MENKDIKGFIVNINNRREYKATIIKNGIEHYVWVNLFEYIGYQVKMIQKIKNISTNELTEKGGFSNSTIISRIKSGKHSFRIDTIYRLCIGLGCKSSDLLPF